MTRLFVYMIIAKEKFFKSLSKYWKRILVGCAVGWVVAMISGAFLLFSLEEYTDLNLTTLNLLGFAYAWFVIALGGLVSFGLRKKQSLEHISESRSEVQVDEEYKQDANTEEREDFPSFF